jgi:copper(I)-binding protein
MSMRASVLAAQTVLQPAPACAEEYTVGAITISEPWSRVPPTGAKAAVGYLTVTNTGREPDRLVGGTIAIADKLELHETTLVDGVMQMRELTKGLEIKPGQIVHFRPGAHHMMFAGLRQRPKLGDRIRGTLVFERAGTAEIEYHVEPLGATRRDARQPAKQ